MICLTISSTTFTNFNTRVTNKNRADTTALSTALTNTSVINKSGADTKVNSNKSQSVLFGSVGAALAVGAIATVAVVGIAVLIGKKQRKRRSVSLIIILSVQFYFNYIIIMLYNCNYNIISKFIKYYFNIILRNKLTNAMYIQLQEQWKLYC